MAVLAPAARHAKDARAVTRFIRWRKVLLPAITGTTPALGLLLTLRSIAKRDLQAVTLSFVKILHSEIARRYIEVCAFAQLGEQYYM